MIRASIGFPMDAHSLQIICVLNRFVIRVFNKAGIAPKRIRNDLRLLFALHKITSLYTLP